MPPLFSASRAPAQTMPIANGVSNKMQFTVPPVATADPPNRDAAAAPGKTMVDVSELPPEIVRTLERRMKVKRLAPTHSVAHMARIFGVSKQVIKSDLALLKIKAMAGTKAGQWPDKKVQERREKVREAAGPLPCHKTTREIADECGLSYSTTSNDLRHLKIKALTQSKRNGDGSLSMLTVYMPRVLREEVAALAKASNSTSSQVVVEAIKFAFRVGRG